MASATENGVHGILTDTNQAMPNEDESAAVEQRLAGIEAKVEGIGDRLDTLGHSLKSVASERWVEDQIKIATLDSALTRKEIELVRKEIEIESNARKETDKVVAKIEKGLWSLVFVVLVAIISAVIESRFIP